MFILCLHSGALKSLLWEWNYDNYDNIIAQYKSQLILYQYMHNTMYCFGGYRIVFCCALNWSSTGNMYVGPNLCENNKFLLQRQGAMNRSSIKLT